MRPDLKSGVFFNRLGALVESRWAKRDYDEAAFSEVAMSALSELPPCEHVSFYDCAKMGLLMDPLPKQHDLDANFGQPPLTVYWGTEFRIELLFWVEGIPGIHQHGFSGGFHVLSGSSLQTEWSFTAKRRVVSRLVFGSVALMKAELLATGASRAIIAGNRMIHSTFHLERPSVTCVIRTNREFDQLPQYSYVPPSVAYAPLEVCPTIQRRLQLIRMLINSGRLAECFDLLGNVFERADTYAAFRYLMFIFAEIPEGAERNGLISAARHRHAELIETILPAFEEEERRHRILRLRRAIENPDLQFFLALLLNVPERSLILSLIGEKYKYRDPVDIVTGWLHSLSQAGALETHWPESWFTIAREFLADPCVATSAITDIHTKNAAIRALASYWLLVPLFKGSLSVFSAPGAKRSAMHVGSGQ